MNKLGFTCADSLRMSASISNALTFACLGVELAETARDHPNFFFFKMAHAMENAVRDIVNSSVQRDVT